MPELARRRGITEEEALFSIMRKQPSFYGALSDWDEFEPITIAVIREMKPYMTYAQISESLTRVVTLYDTQVISVLRVFSDVKRLAYFINEMIETLLEIDDYRRVLLAEYGLDEADYIAARGLVLKRITSEDVQTLLFTDRNRFFRAESFCASRILHGVADAARVHQQTPALAG
ncbi:hypothetical protein [Sutterella sp.]|uniref:hypothetical protein n=1 Tax=Sutterella sp. TaxID=1981025 RepID=UPI003FD7E11A